MTEPLLERLEPAQVNALPDPELAQLLSELWGDPYVRAELYGSRSFIVDRIRAYATRGYFTARERQGILRSLFAPSFDIRRRVQRAVLRRQAVAGSDDAGGA
ncbi:MAG TPA: hypothetical protein VF212_17950 [Longimicrobiales bacterium]